jgi:hypothetical protein
MEPNETCGMRWVGVGGREEKVPGSDVLLADQSPVLTQEWITGPGAQSHCPMLGTLYVIFTPSSTKYSPKTWGPSRTWAAV